MPDYADVLTGQSDYGPITQQDDLVARLVASLQETAEWQWIRQQMALDEQAEEQAEALEPIQREHATYDPDATYSGPGDDEDEDSEGDEEELRRPVRHSHDEAEAWMEQVERGGSESGKYEDHEIGQGLRLRSRRSKDKPHFKYFPPDPKSGRAISAEEFSGRGAVEQDEPITGAILESNRESIMTAVRNGSMSESEGRAALAALQQHERRSREFSAALARQFGPAQGRVNTSVNRDVHISEPLDDGESDVLGADFASRAMAMDAEARRTYDQHSKSGRSYEQEIAHHAKRQRVRHARKVHQASQLPQGMTLAPALNKKLALAAALDTIHSKGAKSYESTLQDYQQLLAGV
jgi:hypothetical protein